jgi:polar amino acid transport system substrate-binding protein
MSANLPASIRAAATAFMTSLLVSGCAALHSEPSREAREALAPTGKLRVAFASVQIYGTRDAATGDFNGTAIDLGKELARRLGVGFEPVVYSGFPALVAGAKAGEWDVGFTGINAERAAAMDFSAPFMEIEVGYLVRAGAPIASIADVDKAGIRVGVLDKSPPDVHLSRTIKNATLIRAKSADEVYALIGDGKVDVVSTGKTGLFSVAAKNPGSRVLDGNLFVDVAGVGVPKGRNPAAAAYVTRFVEDAKAEGLVQAAIDNAGLRGVKVAPNR